MLNTYFNNKFQSNLNVIIFLSIFIILRIFWIKLFPSTPVDDNYLYWKIGRSIIDHDYISFPSAARQPGFPIYLSFFYKLFGNDLNALRFINVILNFFTLLIALIILNKFIQNKKIILIFLFIFTFSPSSISSNSIITPEIISLFLYFLMIYLFFTNNNSKKFIFIGAVTAILTYVKPLFLLFPIFLLIVNLLFKIFEFTKKSYLIFFLSFLLTLSPLFIRNYLVMDKFIPVSTLGSFALNGANNEHADGEDNYSGLYMYSLNDLMINDSEILQMDEIKNNFSFLEKKVSSIYYDEFIKYVKNKPGEFLTTWFFKTFDLYRSDSNIPFYSLLSLDRDISNKKLQGYQRSFTRLCNMYYWIILFAAIIQIFSLVYLKKISQLEKFFLILLAYSTGLGAVFFTGVRFHYINDPILFYFASKFFF